MKTAASRITVLVLAQITFLRVRQISLNERSTDLNTEMRAQFASIGDVCIDIGQVEIYAVFIITIKDILQHQR